MSGVFGWWEFDRGEMALMNRVTRQGLVFMGRPPHQDDDTVPSLRFLYEDDEIQFPLVVRIPRRFPDERQRWVVDYAASTKSWQRATGTEGTPPYGVWRRVDDATIDALLCWPELVEKGTKPEQIFAEGGWSNGGWRDDLRRQFRFYNWVTEGKPLAARTLEPLDRPTSAPWHFRETPQALPGVRLARIEPVGNRIYLPPDALLTGFESRVPHLRRGDGRAVMFPAGLASDFHRGEDYCPRMLVDYADEEVLLRFGCENSFMHINRKNEPVWGFEVSRLWPNEVGLRDRDRFDPGSPHGLPLDLFAVEYQSSRPIAVLSYRLWRRLADALVDGWLNWRSAQHIPETPEWLAWHSSRPDLSSFKGMSLRQRRGIEVNGGYVGGIHSPRYKLTAWLDGALIT
jgi:hypothetical protein